MSEKTYRIGEAAALLNLKTYVLRFWEVEFPQISPVRTEKGQRLYREEDIAILRRIRYLLHERGLTIEGARRILAEEGSRAPSGAQEQALSLLPPDSDLEESPEPRDSERAPGSEASREGGESAMSDRDSSASAPSAENLSMFFEVAEELEAISELLHTLGRPDGVSRGGIPAAIPGNPADNVSEPGTGPSPDKDDDRPRIVFRPRDFE